MTGCSDHESFTSSQSARLTFSTDTLSFDTLFAKVSSPTYAFWVYNRTGNDIRCENVKIESGNQSGFRANVDGEYLGSTTGYRITDVNIRRNDSLCVFVELTAAENGQINPQKISDNLVFTLQNGAEQKVALTACVWDAKFLRGLCVRNDTVINSPMRPVVVYDEITVDSSATLTVSAGTTLYFHSGAGIDVYGRLVCDGEVGKEVVLRGDRTDRMFSYLPYDRISGQWQGINFHESSYGNRFAYTDLHGACNGIVCDSSDVSRVKLSIENCSVHNCQGYGMKLINCWVNAQNSLFSNALNDCVAIYGGNVVLQHCTLAQFYPFDNNRGVALSFYNNFEGKPLPLFCMDCLNTIITGYGDDVISSMSFSEGINTDFNYRFVNSLIRTHRPAEIDGRLQDVIIESEVNTDSIGENNFQLIDIDVQNYDFHLAPMSKAINHGSTKYTLPIDRDGRIRDEKPDIGCYEFLVE